MRSGACIFLVVMVGLSLGACRQADGPMPTPSADVLEELNDVTRDLQNVASARDPQARQDLADDLRKYVEAPDAVAAVGALSQRVATVLAGVDLAEQEAERLAHSLWLTATASELSERQMEVLRDDVQSLLLAQGIAEESARELTAQMSEVQGAVAARSRRWYELF
ncbi:MAG: hypothetical protein O2930_15010 [Acidobacteria bacterium]|nr:hypothetical protein [Acidobacteriota bacterium]